MASKLTQVVTLGAYGGLATAAGGAVADEPVHGAVAVLGLGLVVCSLARVTLRRRGRARGIDAPPRSGQRHAASHVPVRAPKGP